MFAGVAPCAKYPDTKNCEKKEFSSNFFLVKSVFKRFPKKRARNKVNRGESLKLMDNVK